MARIIDERHGRVRLYQERGRGGLWLRWTEGHSQKKRKVATKASGPELEEARRNALRLDDRLERVAVGIEVGNDPQLDLSKLLDDFCRWKKGRYVMPAEIESIRRCVQGIFDWSGWTRLDQVTRRGVERYLDHLRDDLKRSARTQDKHQSCLKSLFRWADDEGRIATSPLKGLRKRTGPETRVRQIFGERALPPAIMRQAKNGPPWQPTAVALGYYGALRLREVRELPWARVLFKTKEIELRPEDQKNKRHSFVAMSPELVEVLRIHKARHPERANEASVVCMGMPLDPSREHRAMLARAGIPYRDAQNRVGDFHALRHSRLTHLARDGMSLAELQDFARHSDPKITRKYVRENQAGVRRALARTARKQRKGNRR